MSKKKVILSLKQLVKSYPQAAGKCYAVKGVSIDVEERDIYGVIGLSGAGKSTLLRMVNLLEKPDQGEVVFKGQTLNHLSESELREQRKKMAMIFQNFNLFQQRSVLDNVLYPLQLSHLPRAQAKEKASYLLELVGLKEKIQASPCQLSGGQQQRVAIARALANDPDLLLSDESTSALDPASTREILELLTKLNEEIGLTILLITHQMNVVRSICNRLAIMADGEVVEAGSVQEVFHNPASPFTRKLIFPYEHIETQKGTLQWKLANC